MKKTIVPWLLLLCHSVFSQTNVYIAGDGTHITVTINDAHPDHLHKMAACIGYYGMEGTRFVNLSYYQPKLFYLQAGAGQNNYMADGSLLLVNILKKKETPHLVRLEQAGGRKKRYIVRLPIEKRISFGLHGGVGYTDFSSAMNQVYGSNNSPYTTSYAIAGISFLKARHTDMTIDERKRFNLHVLTLINADVVSYFGQELKGKLPTDTRTLNDLTRQVGFRLYYEGRSTFYARKGNLGFWYMAGTGLNSYKINSYAIFGGLGIFYSFL